MKKRGIIFLVLLFSLVCVSAISFENISFDNYSSSLEFGRLNISDQNISLYYGFDMNNSLSKIYDYTNNDNEGVLINSPLFSSGYIGNSYFFNGSNYILVNDSNSLDLVSNFSITSWIKINDSSQSQKVLSKGSYTLGIDSDEKPYFEVISNGSFDTWTNTGNFSGAASNSAIRALNIYNGNLYAATNVAGNVFIYNKSNNSWNDTGNLEGVTAVFSLIVYNEKLYAGVKNGKVFEYNESNNSWEDKWPSSSVGFIFSLSVYNDKLYVGKYDGIYIYDEVEETWSLIKTLDDTQKVEAFIVHNNKLFVGTTADLDYGNIYAYDGNSWENWETWNSSEIQVTYDFIHYRGDLYAGTKRGLLKYNDSNNSWALVINSSSIISLCVYGGNLYAGTGSDSNYAMKYNDSDNSWVNLTNPFDPSHFYSLINYGGKLYAGSNVNSSVFVGGEGSTVYSNVSVSNGSWNLLSSIFEGNFLKLYLNNSLVGREYFNHSLELNDNALLIGSSLGSSMPSSKDFFEGWIDEVMIFNKSLSIQDLEEIYSGSFERFFSSGEYLFNYSFTGNRLNMSLSDCSVLGDSSMEIKFNDGSFVDFSSCGINNKVISSGIYNLTLRLISDSNQFNSPFFLDNFVFSSWTYVAETISGGSTGGSTSLIFVDGVINRGFPKGHILKLEEGDLEIEDFDSSRVNLSFDSSVVEVGLEESEKVDLDSDGFYDIEVSYGGIIGSFASLIISEIYEEVPAVSGDVVVEERVVDEVVDEVVGFFRRFWNWFKGLFSKN